MSDPRFQEGVELFNRQEFFEAHEVWEDLWREARVKNPEIADFYRGLIQMAGAYHHLTKQNFNGANMLFASSLKYMKSCKLEAPINLEKLLLDFESSFLKANQFARIEFR